MYRILFWNVLWYEILDFDMNISLNDSVSWYIMGNGRLILLKRFLNLYPDLDWERNKILKHFDIYRRDERLDTFVTDISISWVYAKVCQHFHDIRGAHFVITSVGIFIYQVKHKYFSHYLVIIPRKQSTLTNPLAEGSNTLNASTRELLVRDSSWCLLIRRRNSLNSMLLCILSRLTILTYLNSSESVVSSTNYQVCINTFPTRYSDAKSVHY